jgi:hypothetical protein
LSESNRIKILSGAPIGYRITIHYLARDFASRDQSTMPPRTQARPVRRLSKAQYEMLAAFRYQLRQFLHFSELAAQDAGLTPRQHQALLAIKGFPERETITIGLLWSGVRTR